MVNVSALDQIKNMKVCFLNDIQLSTISVLPIGARVESVMLCATTPLHYCDVDELLQSLFGVKHSSYHQLKRNPQYIQLLPTVYVHKSKAPPQFLDEFEATKREITARISEFLEYAKVPVPGKCFAALFSRGSNLTNRTLRSIIHVVADSHPYLYKTAGTGIASREVEYDKDITGCLKPFLCDHCSLERKIPVSELLVDGFGVKIPELAKRMMTSTSAEKSLSTGGPAVVTLKSPFVLNSSDRAVAEPVAAPPPPETPISEVNWLDKLPDDPFFHKLLKSDDPAGMVPGALFEKWKTAVNSSPYPHIPLSDIAPRVGTTWPTTRSTETLADFLQYDIPSLLGLPALGRKKTRTLMLCFAYAAYTAVKSDVLEDDSICYGYMDSPAKRSAPSFETLVTSERPATEITDELWEEWCAAIEISPYATKRVSEIAHKYRLVWPHSKREETVTTYTKFSLKEILNLPGYGAKKIRTLVLCIASLGLAPSSGEKDDPAFTVKDVEPYSARVELDALVGAVQKIIDQLPPRSCGIIRKRFGIGCKAFFTLEEIAIESGLTRERVRQIVKNITQRICCTEAGEMLSRMVSRLNIDPIWAELADEYGVISKSQMGRIFEKSLKGELLFALECCGKNLQSWLSSISREEATLWHRSLYGKDQLEALAYRANRFILGIGTPLPLATVTRHFDLSHRDAGLVVFLTEEFRIFDGYVFQGRITPRGRRASHLHGLLCGRRSHLSLRNLISWHNERYPSESCSTRDADIVMREAPQLFVSMGDKGWAAIGEYTAFGPASHNSKGYLGEGLWADTSESGQDLTVASVLITILKRRGLANFVDIVSDFRDIVEHALSEHSVSPILTSREEFTKFAPSVYGLTERLQECSELTSELLLNDYDCQLYAMARYAGEKFLSFPLWNAGMEKWWCEWAEQEQNRELRESLFYIATPDEWPASERVRRVWKEKVEDESISYYLLRPPRYDDCVLPDLRSLFALVKYVNDVGSINWIAANRVLGRRIDDYHTAADIALLVCLGIVEPAHNWQKNHVAREGVEQVGQKLSLLLHHDHTASWGSTAAEFLLDGLTLEVNARDVGWVSVGEVLKLLQSAAADPSHRAIYTAGPSAGEDPLESRLPKTLEGASLVEETSALDLRGDGSDGSLSGRQIDNNDELIFFLDDDDVIVLN
jgi:hypothetical protein